MKTCTRCKTERPLDEFTTRQNGHKKSWCVFCVRKAGQENYQQNKQRYMNVASARTKALKEKVWALKNVPCADCKKTYPHYVMDFDHLGKEKKTYSISEMLRRKMAFDVIEAEISKCEVVCSNCHRERTYKRSNGEFDNDTGAF